MAVGWATTISGGGGEDEDEDEDEDEGGRRAGSVSPAEGTEDEDLPATVDSRELSPATAGWPISATFGPSVLAET